MMRTQRLVMRAIAFATILSLAGCINVISRNPLYDRDKDRIFDSKLVGKWKGNFEREAMRATELVFEIKSGEDVAYVAIIPEADDSQSSRAAPRAPQCESQQELEELPFDLVKFGSRRYVFAGAAHETSDRKSGESQHAGPIAKLKRRGDKLYIRPLHVNELLNIARANPTLLPHEWQPTVEQRASDGQLTIVKGTLILKCTREQMMDVLRKFGDELFPDDAKLTFKRVKEQARARTDLPHRHIRRAI